jgi:hypothetical protein
MTLVVLDTQGRLQEFHAMPPQVDPPAAPVPPRWEPLFEAASLTLSTFNPVAPEWNPRGFADVRAAWEGQLPDRPEYRVRVEAAAYRGRPVSLLIIGPWSRASRMQALTPSSAQTAVIGVVTILIIALAIAAMLLARHNVRARRADTRGAWRLALFVVVGSAGVFWVLAAHHVPDVNVEMNTFTRLLGNTLVAAGLLWVIYVAVEPYVRRFWPDGILGWTRLMSGYVRDPRVGRDVLAGCAFAAVLGLAEIIYELLPQLLGYPPPIPRFQDAVATLTGMSGFASEVFNNTVGAILVAMFAALGFVLLRLIVRRTSLAIAAFVLVLALFQSTQVLTSGTSVWVAAAYQTCMIATLTIMVVRHGLLVTAVALAVAGLLVDIPLTLSLSHWTATTSNLAVLSVITVACFGFYAARAGQPLFGKYEV